MSNAPPSVRFMRFAGDLESAAANFSAMLFWKSKTALCDGLRCKMFFRCAGSFRNMWPVVELMTGVSCPTLCFLVPVRIATSGSSFETFWA